MIDLLMVLEVQGLPKILTKAEIESKASEQYEGETSEKDCITSNCLSISLQLSSPGIDIAFSTAQQNF